MADSLTAVAPATAIPKTGRARWRVPLSGIVLVLIVGFCVFGPYFSPYGANELDNLNPLASPSAQHWLGTDEVGRDMFTRLMYGGRLTLEITVGSVAIAFVLGTLWGMLAATRGGIVDELLMRIADVSMAIPPQAAMKAPRGARKPQIRTDEGARIAVALKLVEKMT